MLQAAAMQPWRRQPAWSAEDMQLPATEYGNIPAITTKKEPYHGTIFYRRPGMKGDDFHNFSLEPPEFATRLAKPGE
eukprot:5317471-Alexandrium_andersonii.AAC.1